MFVCVYIYMKTDIHEPVCRWENMHSPYVSKYVCMYMIFI